MSSARVAIRSASATATSAPEPEVMAKAVPKTPPAVISGGMAAPMAMLPMNASSSVPPTARPVWMSPSAMPTSGPMTTGRWSIDLPVTWSQ